MTIDERTRALWNGAKLAMSTAYGCEANALHGLHRQHADFWLSEASRHRERAAWYLERRKMLIQSNVEEVRHEHAA